MVKAAKTEKTNAMRLLDAAGVAYQSYSYSTDDGQIDGMSVAAKTGFAAEHVFKTLVAMGPSRNLYVFVIPVCGELDLKKSSPGSGRKKHCHAAAKGFAEAYWLYTRRLLPTWHEKALSHLC